MKTLTIYAALLSVMAGSAMAEVQMHQQTYSCDRGVHLQVSYINPADGAGLAVMMVEGKLVTMRAAPSGSGVRYIAMDEQDSYRLYTKGSDAFVRHLAADHTAKEITILDNCVAQ